ncbi:MAG: hypothetical protein ACRDQH_06110 [Pseudonocardiaceae bacterium]
MTRSGSSGPGGLRSPTTHCTRHPQHPDGIRGGRYRRLAMDRSLLPITFTLDGEPVQSITHLLRAGPYVLVLQTVMPQRGLAVELHSTFVGHGSVHTQATHLLLGPVGQPAEIITREDTLGIEDPVGRPASCVYSHCYELTALLAERGLAVKVDRLPAQPVSLPQ